MGIYENQCGCGNKKLSTSKVCESCYHTQQSKSAAARESIGTGKYRRCNGSGTMTICETKVPHKHCNCLWPISLEEDQCHICSAEMAGKRLIPSEQSLRGGLERIELRLEV